MNSCAIRSSSESVLKTLSTHTLAFPPWKKGGVFISKNGGTSWSKQSDAVSGGTGPHYYQELYASPHQEGRLYLMSNTVQISDLIGISVDGVRKSKQRIKKKFELNQKLDEYIINL